MERRIIEERWRLALEDQLFDMVSNGEFLDVSIIVEIIFSEETVHEPREDGYG